LPSHSGEVGLIDERLINIYDALSRFKEFDHLQCIPLPLDEAPLRVGLYSDLLDLVISEAQLILQHLPNCLNIQLHIMVILYLAFDEMAARYGLVHV